MKIEARELALDILTRLPFDPNEQQLKVAFALARFCTREDQAATPGWDRVFVLNGYAGTGKTSLSAALVKALMAARIPTFLMAPTGRAAKVFSSHAGVHASTIHRGIYQHVLAGSSAGVMMKSNNETGAVYIVDEASMIGGAGDADITNVLRDLIHYVYSRPDNRLILLGDTAQLPPVGLACSPAMDRDVLRDFGLKVTRTTMTAVARQGAQSGILYNATRLRDAQDRAADVKDLMKLRVAGFDDVKIAEPEELPDLLATAYSDDGPEDTILITRSNLSATQFNQAIRAMVMYREEELSTGDLLVAAKNNYFWTRTSRRIDFIANGETMRLVRVLGTEVRYGLRFADVVLEIPDVECSEFKAKIILDSLTGSAAALDRDAYQRLYEGVYNDPDVMPAAATHEQRLKLLRKSPYWNALQVKYAYAVTCHKAQGGQWKNVFIDLSYIPTEQVGGEFYRWLYTAVTRAKSQLYLIRPPEEMLAE